MNRTNNMGDAMSHMRSLKEHKERHPELELDFVSNLYLHWIMANHTDLFGEVIFDLDPCAYAQSRHYDGQIEFTVDWSRACEIGIVKAWGERTLGFTPSINKPYFLLTEEERLTAWAQLDYLMHVPHEPKPTFRKAIVLQLESVSDYKRGFRPEDWNRVVEMIPEDVAIFYMPPLSWRWKNPLTPRPNLIVLPAYAIGETAGLMQIVDAVIAVHSGPMFLAIAVDAPKIIQFGFNNGGPPGLMQIPGGQGENHFFPSNGDVDWARVQDAIIRATS